MPGPDIFLSYNREDQAVARLYADAFAHEGYDVWWDVTLRSGDAYDEVTETALREAKAVVVLWSQRSVVSRWVRAEATVADRNRTLVPVMIELCERPVMFELTQTADLSHWAGDTEDVKWRAFLEDVRRFAGRGASRNADQPMARAAAAKALPSLPRRASIVVLPFANLSGDPEQEYFVQGMMEEIVATLTRIRSLRVLSSESSLALAKKNYKAQEISSALGVRYILQGSVRWSGSRVRIAINLMDGTQGSQIWADRFDDALENIFELQDRIAFKVASIIEPSIHEAEVRRVARQPVENLGCYDLYLRAAPLRTSCNREEVLHALELLDRALEHDPEFAPALAQAAGCHSQIFYNGWSEDATRHRDQGLKLAERAARNGADDASVLAQCANAVMELDTNISRAKALVERATNLNPSCARAWFISGLLCLVTGDGDGAVERLETAATLDPISPLHDVIQAHIGIGRIQQGDMAEGLRILQMTTHRTSRLHLAMAACYGHLDMADECRAELALFRASSPLAVEEAAQRMVALFTNTPLRNLLIEALRRAAEAA